MKKVELIDKFQEEAHSLLEIMKQDKGHSKEQMEQYRKVFDAYNEIPNKAEDSNREDIQDIINWTSMALKKPLCDITKSEFLSYLDSKLFSPPKVFDFYFRLGDASDFPDGYAIGKGKMYPFSWLPNQIQEDLRTEFPFRLDEDRAYGGETLEDYTKRREREWYLYLQVNSVGHYKAREKAIIVAKNALSILKLVYDLHGTLFERETQSPFDYQFQVQDSSWTGGGGYQHERQLSYFYRRDFFDEMVSDINTMANSNNPSDIEKRILSVIDIIGMIDDLTPLHVRFLLCIISLENLLIDDRDYLGWKLGEKMAYLLGDTPAWFITFHKIKPEDVKQTLTEDFKKENMAKTRMALDKTIREFYEKRSGFAHGGLQSDAKKKITTADYNLASSLVRWTVEKLLELKKKNGIDHIRTKELDGDKEDTKALNHHVENLKYS